MKRITTYVTIIVSTLCIVALWLCTGCGPGIPSVPPEAAFSADKTGVAPGQQVQFTDLSTGDPTAWSWDFDNDGVVDSTAQNPAHAYTTEGFYTVSLTVTNSEGSDTETKENYIHVSEAIVTPTQDIKEVLAAQEGVLEEDVDIQFCELAPLADEGNIFAVGAIIDETKSLVFFYDRSARQITDIEASYVATTAAEASALSIAARYTSRWTGNLIVPCEIVAGADGYSFKYYDGYDGLLSRWSYGWGSVDLEEGTVEEWGPHIG